MNRGADAFVEIESADGRKHERRPGRRSPSQLRSTHYPILSDLQLAARWNISRSTLQRWCTEKIGPPAWRIGKQPRYLETEVEAFERKAQVTRKSTAEHSLSESSPTPREEAIEQAAQHWPKARERQLLNDIEVADITGLPAFWFTNLQARRQLGIPHYVLGDGRVVRFNLEQMFRWEVAHLVPRGWTARRPDALSA